MHYRPELAEEIAAARRTLEQMRATAMLDQLDRVLASAPGAEAPSSRPARTAPPGIEPASPSVEAGRAADAG